MRYGAAEREVPPLANQIIVASNIAAVQGLHAGEEGRR